jgi:hypothetical protein
MRFPTWSTLTNTFTVSTVALLSLIPTTNAIPSGLEIKFSHPANGPKGETDFLLEGFSDTITWYVPKG